MTALSEALVQARASVQQEWGGPIDQAINDGVTLAEQYHLLTSKEGVTVAQFLFATSRLLRPILRDPVYSATLNTVVEGGNAYNPHIKIDIIPGVVAETTWRHSRDPERILLFVEELGFIHLGKHRRNSIVIVDPLDGSSSIGIGLKDQVSGVVVCDHQGNFLAGGIASLVDNTFALAERGMPPMLFSFNEITNTLTRLAIPSFPMHNPPRYQTLPRRLTMLSQPFKDAYKEPSLHTFGGYGVLMLALGKQDFMIDPKGQPVNEGAIWYNVAQQFGCVVTHPDGSPINLPHHIAYAVQQKNMDGRIPVVIARTAEIHRQIVPIAQIAELPLAV